MTLLKILLYLFLCSFIALANEKVQNLASTIATPFYNVYNENVIEHLNQYIVNNKEVEAIKIYDNLLEQTSIVYYKHDGKFIYKLEKEFPNSLNLPNSSYSTEIFKNGKIIGTITVFTKGISFSKKEQEFIKSNKNIVLGTDSQWSPYVIKNSDGSISGYDQDVIDLINDVSGLNIKLELGRWENIKKRAKNKNISGLSTGIYAKYHEEYFNFSKPYLSLEKIIYANKNNKNQINSLKDLQNMSFAVQKGNTLERNVALSIKGVKIVEYDSITDVIESVSLGNTDLMLANTGLIYKLTKKGNNFIKPVLFLKEKPLELVFSIRKDWPEAISIIDKSLSFIGERKLLELKKKWFFQTSNKSNLIDLNMKEKLYLLDKKVIKMCVDPNWYPFEKIENEKHIGIVADYMKIFSQSIETPIELISTNSWQESLEFAKSRKCDILSMASKTPQRERYMNFTSSYLDSSIVLATRNNVSFVDSISQIIDKKLGVEKASYLIEMLKLKYPNINIIEVDSIDDGLNRVEKGSIFGYLDNSIVLNYLIEKEYIGTLTISGKFDKKANFSVATRDDEPLLLSIFQKAVDSINQRQKDLLFKKWVTTKIERIEVINYSLVYKIIAFSVFLLILFGYWNRKISKTNKELEIAKKKIEILATTDKLTGLFNRAKLDELFEYQIEKCKRYNKDMLVAIVDIDHFKKINDTYGHQIGDKVLLEISNLLKRNIRSTDHIGRWGGEEFVIISPETNQKNGLEFIEKLRVVIATYEFSVVKTKTASFGVTQFIENDTMESIIKRADDALYEAKNSGRNKIVFK